MLNTPIITGKVYSAFWDVKKEWYPFIKAELDKSNIVEMISTLESEYQSKEIFPDVNDLLKPLKIVNLNEIKVVIIGQDPYHTPGVADGLAFSSKQSKVPPSLRNVFKEIENTMGIKNSSPNLLPWAKQGVFLLNTVLSVESGRAKSHSKIGWQGFVIDLIKYIDKNKQTIFVLWGNEAHKYEQYLNNATVIKGAHPSPLAGNRFFGSDYFNRINDLLQKKGVEVIDWST